MPWPVLFVSVLCLLLLASSMASIGSIVIVTETTTTQFPVIELDTKTLHHGVCTSCSRMLVFSMCSELDLLYYKILDFN